MRAARQDFDHDEISEILGGFKPETPIAATAEPEMSALWKQLFAAPLTQSDCTPRAWRLDTSAAQLYEIPNLLSPEECNSMIDVIDRSLRPSTVTRGPADYRTSRTCDMKRSAQEEIAAID